MLSDNYDVIVIGAGPVGGYLAWKLTQSGLTVLLVEEHSEIGRPFQCAGMDACKRYASTCSSLAACVWPVGFRCCHQRASASKEAAQTMQRAPYPMYKSG